MKLCKDCNINSRYSSNGRIYSYCLNCQNFRNKKYQESPEVKEKIKLNTRRYQREKNGFTSELFQQLLIKQEFKCAICLCEINESSHADHNHRNGKARGILCHSCNTLLGRLESIGFDWVDKAKRYLGE